MRGSIEFIEGVDERLLAFKRKYNGHELIAAFNLSPQQIAWQRDKPKVEWHLIKPKLLPMAALGNLFTRYLPRYCYAQPIDRTLLGLN